MRESLGRLGLDYVDLIQCHDIEFTRLDQVGGWVVRGGSAAAGGWQRVYAGCHVGGLPLPEPQPPTPEPPTTSTHPPARS